MLKIIPIELCFLLGALLFLALTPTGSAHYSLCPIDNIGFSWCPGCGLGRSLRYLLHADLRSSLDHHWFGIPALLILIYRILQLLNIFQLNLKYNKRKTYGQRSSY